MCSTRWIRSEICLNLYLSATFPKVNEDKYAFLVHAIYIMVFFGWLLRNYIFQKPKKIVLLQFSYLSCAGLTAFTIFYPSSEQFGLYYLILCPFAVGFYWVLSLFLAIFGNLYLKKTTDIKKDIIIGLIPIIIAILIFVFLSVRLGIPGVN